MAKKYLDLIGLANYDSKIKAYVDSAVSGGGDKSVVDIGTFIDEEALITYVVTNQLPTGLYKTGIGTDNSSFIFSLYESSNSYSAVLIAPTALTYVNLTKQGDILDYVELGYGDIATKDEIVALDDIQVILDGAMPDIIDDLISTSTTAALSANQGKVLNDKIDAAIQAAIQNTWNGEY